MNGGWLCLHRKIRDSLVFQDPELLKLWILCLCLASYKDNSVLLDGRKTTFNVLRGQFITGRLELHRAYYQDQKASRRKNQKSARTLWRWMKLLQQIGCLTLKSVHNFTLVTIVNYQTYNDVLENDVQRVSNACPTHVQGVSKACPQLTINTIENKEEQRHNNGALLPDAEQPFEHTPQGLAQAWCFHCTRRRNGRCADDPADMTGPFTSLLAQGFLPETILAEITKRDGPLPTGRDRSEHFWQFKQRLLDQAGNGTHPRESLEDRISRIVDGGTP